MKHLINILKSLLIVNCTLFIFSCSSPQIKTEVASPDGKIKVAFNVNNEGEISYNVNVNGNIFIGDSQLGFEAKDGLNLKNSFEIIDVNFSSEDETWTQIWGENKTIRNHYNEMAVELLNEDSIFLTMRFRIFDDGLGFRYEYKVTDVDSIYITDELTSFNIKGEGTSWSIPASFDTYELLYRTLPLNEVDNANTPFTFKTTRQQDNKSTRQQSTVNSQSSESESIYANIHEAALTDFPEMTLEKSENNFSDSQLLNFSSFKSKLAPYPDGIKAKFEKDNFKTPWRTIQIADEAVGLINSSLILNLNEPCALEGDLSWIRPMKYVGVWWSMHLGVESWVIDDRHGATTENAKRHIDFAANNNIDAVLFEGWNEGWEDWNSSSTCHFDYTKPYADFDIDEIMRYAKERNIEVIGHHETGGNIINYENQLNETYRWTKDKGISYVKTGYAGALPDFHNHHGQYNVRHYRKVVETAARHQIALNVHEPIKPTGIRRTYPNMMTREGARGMEWNAWSEGNPPEHHVMLPFTRLLAGPMDYTPGTFDILSENTRNSPQRKKWNGNDKGNSRVNTTIAKQLANWVILYSPLQMASDMIEHYEDHPMFQFFRDFNPDCDWSEALQGEPGEYVAVVRRAGTNFYLGAATNGSAREIAIPLTFLPKDNDFETTIYADGDNAHWETNPTSYKIEKKTLNHTDTLFIKMAAGGGCAVRFSQQPIKIACIGNSVTFGYGHENPAETSYPSQLAKMLGDDYEVGNFGKSGATLLRKGHRPYNEQEEYKKALEFVPDIAIIHLGLNDTDPRNWKYYKKEFISDYVTLIEDIERVNPGVEIYICRMTPIFHWHHRFLKGTRDWYWEIQETIENIAENIAEVKIIDLQEVLYHRPDLMPDALHPDPEGAKLIAQQVYSAITGDFGGLSLPAIYSDNMVIQRNKPFTVIGKANAGDKITATLGKQKIKTTAGDDGNWKVTFKPLEADGKTYTLTIDADSDIDSYINGIEFNNIAVGEVWLCSGQSNMEFSLRQTTDYGQPIADIQKTDLRLYDMKPRVITVDIEWDSVDLAKLNNHDYYLPTSWQMQNEENIANFSAVAYHFGKMLADSLQVPIGLICNAIGGAPAESYIDRKTLEWHPQLVDILYNYRNNDMIQQWCRERASLNCRKSSNNLQRHPYEPCYLYENCIAPIASYNIKGAIWYQGESNAHNVELHEIIFPTLIDSWRKTWNDDEMPFYFVQLSSHERPSWPHFRDSQRRLAEQIDNCDFVVSSDKGDRWDVHLREKKPVGERLARLALKETYHFENIIAHGPTIEKAEQKGSKMILNFSNADGMTSSDGEALRTFELAGKDDIFHTADKVEVKGSTIVISSKEVKEPIKARYGWQPYTDGNLVNKEGLPASTFELKIENYVGT